MSDTFRHNFPVHDQHVQDYQRIEKNRELIALAFAVRTSSHFQSYRDGFPMAVNDAGPKDTIYLIPSAETLAHVHARDPMADLRRYFGCIKNATV